MQVIAASDVRRRCSCLVMEVRHSPCSSGRTSASVAACLQQHMRQRGVCIPMIIDMPQTMQHPGLPPLLV